MLKNSEFHSVVAPMYNEEGVAEEFVRCTSAAMSGIPHELIVVENGSTDGTYETLSRLTSEFPDLRIVRLSRNFTHQGGITAGLDFATGDTVTVLDGDLQDPPELIPDMIERWRRGADIVFAIRAEREGETVFKKGAASLFYRVIRQLSDTDIPVDAGDFRLMSSRAVEALRGMRERSRYLRGMTGWIGMERATVSFTRKPRFAGETKYNLKSLVRLAGDGIFSFSTRPLQIATWLGFIAAGVGIVLGIAVLTLRLVDDRLLRGWASLMLTIIFFGGVQLVTIGIMGEYIGRIYDETRHRPIYLVRSLDAFSEDITNQFARSPLPRR